MGKRMKKAKSDLELSLDEVVVGRLSEFLRESRKSLERLEAQLESQAYRNLKAFAKEASEVTAKYHKDAQRLREEDSNKPNSAGSGVQVRDGATPLYSTSYTPSVYAGLSFAEWNLRGVQGEVRQGLPQEDGLGNRTASGQRYKVVVHAR